MLTQLLLTISAILVNKLLFTSDPIAIDYVMDLDPDFIISYGYRHIITPDIIDAMSDKVRGDRIINLHISYLPYNRGSDPNLWSWLNDTYYSSDG